MFVVLDRYLMSEVIKTLLSILIVLILIVAGHNFIIYLEDVAAGKVAHDVLFTMLGLELAKELSLLVPPAFFFAVLMTLGRMYQNSEMTALFAGGVGRGRIFRAYAWVVIPVMLLTAWLTLYAKPLVEKTLKEYKEAQEESADVVNMSPGRFNESNTGDTVFYFEEINEERTLMKNIFVQSRKDEKLGIIRSKEGYQYTDSMTGDSFIVMLNGYRYDGHPGEFDYTVSTFEKYAVRTNDSSEISVRDEPKFRSTAALLTSNRFQDYVELQLRISAPLAVLVFAVLSIPLSRSSPRQGMAGRMSLALLIYFFFFNLQAVSGKWMEQGVTPFWIGRWWVHALMLGVAALLMLWDSLWFAAMVRRVKGWIWRSYREGH